MAATKGYKRRARTTRRSFKRRRPTVARAAYTALRKVNKVIRSEEVKKADMTFLSTPLSIDCSGLVNPTTSISAGQTQYTRIGAEILLKYVSVQGIAKLQGSFAVNPSNTVRVIAFIDRQEVTGVSPNLGSLLETVGSTIAPFTRYNRQNVGRFQVLRDFKLLLNTQNPQRMFKINLSFKKMHKVRYQANAALDVIRGSVWLAFVSDAPIVSDNKPTVEGTVRVGFTDD